MHIFSDTYRLVVEHSPDPISRWDTDLKLTFANPAFTRMLAVPETELRGKTLEEMGQPAYVAAPWMEMLQQVFCTATANTYYCTFGNKTFQAQLVPETAPDGTVQGVLAFARDITDLKNAAQQQNLAMQRLTEAKLPAAAEESQPETALQESEVLLAAVLEALPLGIGYTDVSGELLFSNEEMHRYLPNSILPSQDKTRYKRWLAHHPDGRRLERHDYPGARAMRGERVVPGTEMRYTHDDGSNIWTRVASVPIRNGGGQIIGTISVVNDISEFKQASEALRESEQRFRKLVESATLAVWETDAAGAVVTDSPSWRAFTGQTVEEWLDYGWINAIHPDDRAAVERQWRETISTGRNLDTEFRMWHKTSNSWRWSNTRATPIRDADGRLLKWAGMNIDIHDRKVAVEALRSSEERLRQTQESLVIALEAARLGTWDLDLTNDFSGNRNLRHDQIFGYETPQAEWGQAIARQHILEEDLPLFDAAFARAIKTGSLEFEVRVRHPDGSIRWMACSGRFYTDENGHPVRGAGVNRDITERKQAEQQLKDFNALLEQQVVERTRALQENKIRFEAAINVSPFALGIFKSIRSKRQKITDFRIDWVSRSGETITGFNATGKRLLRQFPHLKTLEVFQLLVNTVETGEPTDYEHHYHTDTEEPDLWVRWKAVKLEDGLFVSLEDITARKRAEAEKLRRLALLKQTEEVAQSGSWEFDLLSGSFQWSDGMYRLFGLPTGTPVSPEIYLNSALKADRPKARRILDCLLEKHEAIEETLRIRANGEARTLKIKAIVQRDANGNKSKMLGIDLDVSELKHLEQENLRMRLDQQKALLLAILEAQEEERHRISESLHNGVGQLLYAIKLNLGQVTQPVPKEAFKTTEKLLHDAIDETRRVSHELVPMVLKDFGLEAAVYDMCRRFNTSALHLTCEVDLEGPLEPYVELLVYRISQELLNNVIKHAQATEANVLIFSEARELILKVRDNGKGIGTGSSHQKGIGLRIIADRVKLLNGTFVLSTPPSRNGTLAVIQIPLGG